jgi:hypothetical protein
MADVRVTVIGDIAFRGPMGADPLGMVDRIPPDLRDVLKADLLVANLECILCDTIGPDQRGAGTFPLFAPTRAVEALVRLGVDVVCTASSHMFDYGLAGIESTLKTLDEAGIAHFGIGRLPEVADPCILERGGMRIGFLGFGGGQVPTRRRVGCLLLDSSFTRRAVARARQQCDRLVVYFHEGIEAYNYPASSAVRACHDAVEAGADVVVGTHAHTIQGVEWYRGAPIAYSLGNFMMAMEGAPGDFEYWRSRIQETLGGLTFSRELTAKELVLRCLFRSDGVEAEGIPVVADDSGQPRLPTADEAPQAEAFFRGLCEAFRHPDDPIWRQRDQVERAFLRYNRSAISWRLVFSRLHRLRWRHLRWYLKALLR